MDDMKKTPAGSGRQGGLGSQRFIGALLVLSSAMGFGTLGIFGKTAYASGASTVSVLFLRFLVAGILMTGCMTALRLPWPRGRDLWLLVAMGALGYVGQSFCYFSALQYASAGLTALLLYLYPSLVTLASAALGRQPLTFLKLLLAAVSLLGILLTVSDDIGGTWQGIVFGAGSAVIYTCYILVGERIIPRTGAIPAGTVVMLAAAFVFAVATLAAGPKWPTSMAGWLAVGGIALVATVLSIAAFFSGIRRLGATDAATLSSLEPVVTLILAFIYLGETLRPVQMVGAALVILAVLVLTRIR